jgi:hypothetical protein
MTNEELFKDLKQFITATVSQQTAGLATKEDLTGLATKEELSGLATKEDLTGLATKEELSGLATKIENLRKEMNGRFDEVLNSEIIKDHELRITKLEHRLA